MALLTASTTGPCRVYLNGVEIKWCQQCDPEAGWVDVCVKNSRGAFIIDGDHILTERRWGFVEVVPKQKAG